MQVEIYSTTYQPLHMQIRVKMGKTVRLARTVCRGLRQPDAEITLAELMALL